MQNIKNHFYESSLIINKSGELFSKDLIKVATVMNKAFKNGNKIIICGNGGSAAESQHFSAELTGRYLRERKAMPAVSLTTDTSALTAIGNDYGFDKVFSRQLEALGRPGDVLFCISTSGASNNLIQAATQAKKMKIKVVTITGKKGGDLAKLGNINFIVPSGHTPYIQEVHLVLIHAICDLVESTIE